MSAKKATLNRIYPNIYFETHVTLGAVDTATMEEYPSSCPASTLHFSHLSPQTAQTLGYPQNGRTLTLNVVHVLGAGHM